MNKIEYTSIDQQDLNMVADLWKKLFEHHRVRSPHFAGYFANANFEVRKKGLLDKSLDGALRCDLAKDPKTGKLVGYCISTMTKDKQGELDSIFVEKEYRRFGIGDNFMKKALKWMENQGVTNRIIEVGVGNEEVLPFYARYGFFPRTTILREKD